MILRTSFVIGRDSGAGAAPFPVSSRWSGLGWARTVGKGTQGMSWIHEIDMNRLFQRASPTQQWKAPTSRPRPIPVSQRVFMQEVRTAMGMPFGLPAFEWMVRSCRTDFAADRSGIGSVRTVSNFGAAERYGF